MTPRVRHFAALREHTQAALALVCQIVRRAVSDRGRCLLALSGGSTPLPLYTTMAQCGLGVPWGAVHFFFGDERLVAVGDRRSTFGTIAPLLFTRAPIPVGNIHPMPVEELPPEQAARLYEEEIRDAFAPPTDPIPRFDLILLGLGPDGHMASLFPGSPALSVTDKLVVAVPPPTSADPRVARLTMTMPLINAARNVLFLVNSRGKETALGAVLADKPDPSLPASLVQPENGAGWLILDA